MNNQNTSHFTFIDLFSGAGGFSLGFVQEGFRDLLAIEIDKEVARTYNRNFPESVMLAKDIRKVHSLDILKEIKKPPDVIIASPPCEPFTAANPRRHKKEWSRFYEDPQGDLIFHTIRIIGDLCPSYFVIENVVPMIDGEGKNIIKEEFKTAGFKKVYFNVVSAEKHGNPSVRNRLFLSNIHLGLSQKKRFTVGDAILDLISPSLPNDVPNHQYAHFTHQVTDKAYKIKKGRAAVYFKGATSEKKQWVKLDEKTLSPTIMGKSRFIHPIENRSLTPREHARLMTYPDTFEFIGSISNIYNQIGESVPPLISRLIAKKIKELIVNSLSRTE